MKRSVIAVMSAIAMVAAAGCGGSKTASAPRNKVVRCAVIGGMTMTGLWDQIADMFEAETGYELQTVASGQRPRLAAIMREGKADLLTMHSGDITTDVVAEGWAVNMRPWAHNELVIVGPTSDPAGIRGMTDGAAALKRIAQTQSNFIDFTSNGPREVCHSLWHAAGITPIGPWFMQDESGDHLDVVKFARQRSAYVVTGRMPVLLGKVGSEGMEIMVQGDPAMQRPYVVMEANPKVFPNANHEGARALSDFLVSEKVQTFLATFRSDEFGGLPLFYPLKSYQRTPD